MPKIVSSSVVSSSDHATQNDAAKALHVYYCLCSEFLLVIDADLRQLPRRRTDNAVIVSNARRTYKLTAEADDCVLLKRYQVQKLCLSFWFYLFTYSFFFIYNRRDGYEKQFRYHCPSKNNHTFKKWHG